MHKRGAIYRNKYLDARRYYVRNEECDRLKIESGDLNDALELLKSKEVTDYWGVIFLAMYTLSC